MLIMGFAGGGARTVGFKGTEEPARAFFDTIPSRSVPSKFGSHYRQFAKGVVWDVPRYQTPE